MLTTLLSKKLFLRKLREFLKTWFCGFQIKRYIASVTAACFLLTTLGSSGFAYDDQNKRIKTPQEEEQNLRDAVTPGQTWDKPSMKYVKPGETYDENDPKQNSSIVRHEADNGQSFIYDKQSLQLKRIIDSKNNKCITFIPNPDNPNQPKIVVEPLQKSPGRQQSRFVRRRSWNHCLPH